MNVRIVRVFVCAIALLASFAIYSNNSALISSVRGGGGPSIVVTWSPDGKRIAFPFRGENDGSNIYVMDADGKNFRNIYPRPDVEDFYPTWSPDGKRIAFSSFGAGDTKIYVVDPDGISQPQSTPVLADWPKPVWSPDGTQLAFLDGYDNTLIDPDTGLTHPIPGRKSGDIFLAWSPDGTQIAFQAGSKFNMETTLYVVNTDGSNLHKLTDKFSGQKFLAWSPDGKQLAFERHYEGYVSGFIDVVDVDGGNLRELTNDKAKAYDLAWSPNGKQLVFATMAAEDTSDVWVANADDTRHVRKLTHRASAGTGEMRWSTDGTQIAVQNFFQISVIAVDQGSILKTWDGFRFSWSPNGKQIASYNGVPFCVMDLITGNNRCRDILNCTPSIPAVWSPDGQFIAYSDACSTDKIATVIGIDEMLALPIATPNTSAPP